MKKSIFFIGLLCMAWMPFGQAAAGNPAQTKKAFPSIVLSAPDSPSQKAYLGLPSGDTFSIPQIKAKAVIIEIFSMYCPHCQREAPTVNRLYETIEANPSLKDAVKIIGIGVGNTPFEVDVFRKRYHVPFPLFPDPDFELHKALGETRTPFFIVVRLDGNGTTRVIYQKAGALEDLEEFMNLLLQKSELKMEK